MTSFLKKIGFVSPGGAPSELYVKSRNPSTSGAAAAEALKTGYAALYARNEYMHQLSDDKLRGLIIEETGQGTDSNVTSLILSSIKAIKKFANWSSAATASKSPATIESIEARDDSHSRRAKAPHQQESVGLNLSYTINLNLPATSDVAVFNAIFRSLKENLLKDQDQND